MHRLLQQVEITIEKGVISRTHQRSLTYEEYVRKGRLWVGIKCCCIYKPFSL